MYAGRMLRLSAALVLFCCACGNQPDPAKPTTPVSPTTPEPAASTSASANDPEVVGENPAKPRHRKPFPIHSSCGQVVTIVFGDDPNAPGAGRRTIASNSEIDGPRDAEGKATVSLLDEKGAPIATVHINRGMKQLEIGRSCRTLDAH